MPYSKFPTSVEYPPYYENYIAKVNTTTGILDFLEEQKINVLALIDSLSIEQMSFAYAKGKWTIAELLNHLIDTERIFAYRALCIARGEKVSLPGYDHDQYVKESFANSKSREQLKEEYGTNRNSTIALFKGFENKQIEILGMANELEISVRAIVYIIAGHELHHLQVMEEKYL